MSPFNIGHCGNPSHLEFLGEEDQSQHKYRLVSTIEMGEKTGSRLGRIVEIPRPSRASRGSSSSLYTLIFIHPCEAIYHKVRVGFYTARWPEPRLIVVFVVRLPFRSSTLERHCVAVGWDPRFGLVLRAHPRV